MKRHEKRHGVAAIPNLCSVCGKFKKWDELVTHFVPDTDYSSEDDSYRECLDCIKKRKSAASVVTEKGEVRGK